MAEETGKIWDDIRIACLRKDISFLEQFPFVERIYVGRARANREHIPTRIRRQVLAAGQCAYCGSVERLTIDHIKPYSKGGTHDISNLQCLCWPCNRQKSNKEEM